MLPDEKKTQPTEESVESTTSIAPKGAEVKNGELNKDEAEQIAGGFIVRE
jgi:hypothetical protein